MGVAAYRQRRLDIIHKRKADPVSAIFDRFDAQSAARFNMLDQHVADVASALAKFRAADAAVTTENRALDRLAADVRRAPGRCCPKCNTPGMHYEPKSDNGYDPMGPYPVVEYPPQWSCQECGHCEDDEPDYGDD